MDHFGVAIMVKNKLSQAISYALLTGMGVGMSLCASTASAAEEGKVQRITVTGSSIKGVAAQSASPITVIRTEELAKQGITTTEEALSTVSANQSSYVVAQNVGASSTAGSVADLRGLGSNKTLVLLNGRRLANTPFDTSTVDLTNIPLSMIDRVEVLKDGASAIYGTDAIGGVINFITKKEFRGLNLAVEGGIPRGDGGKSQQYNIFGGFGDLDEQRYNVYAALDFHKRDGVMASERDVSRRGSVLPELGVSNTSGNSFPANVSEEITEEKVKNEQPIYTGNPYAATGCANDGITTPNARKTTCRINTQKLIGIIPATEGWSLLAKGTLKLNEDFNAIAEYVHTDDTITVSIAPDVLSGGGYDYFIPSTSPYYPGNGITPALNGIAGLDKLSVNMRSQGGNRVNETKRTSDRILLGLDGTFKEWDVNGGISYATSDAEDNLLSGYMNNEKVRANLANGTLNPFGPSANANIWNEMGVSGVTNSASIDATNVDITVSRPIYKLSAGDVGFALGAAYRSEDWKDGQNKAVTSLVESTGIDPEQEDNKGSRNLKAVFTEFQIPLHKTLNAQLAARYDDYSDFGSTFNPKAALRWQPNKKLMLRSSYSTGFRAPSLFELNSAQFKTYTQSAWNDPVLCPNGPKGELGSGGIVEIDCETQFKRLTSGNADLKAEESRNITTGIVFEPMKNLVFNFDYFNIKVENQIGTLTEGIIFNNHNKYANKFVRTADGHLDYIIQQIENLGNVKTSGFDMGVQWRSVNSPRYGRLGLSFEGTYIDKYDFQSERNGEWQHAVGAYNGALDMPILRWKHNANISWNYENWGINLQQIYTRGYLDSNDPEQVEESYLNHRVSAYTLYNLSGTYSGFKNTELTLGIKNLFNAEPSASNVTSNFQYGYDPRVTDPMGRVYFGRATYKF